MKVSPPVHSGSPKLHLTRPLRFALIFGACFLLCVSAILTPPIHKADVAFSHLIVGISHFSITHLGGHARIDGAILQDPASGFAVEMRDGCNAVNVTILLLSAIAAFPAPWRLKALGLLAGGAVIQILNIIRFISLFYIGQFSMNWFDFAHGFLWETLLVLDTLVVFWLWANRVARSQAAVHAND